MDDKKLQQMRELEDAADRAGGYVAALPAPEQHVDYRKMLSYCKDKGIDPLDLTLREYNQFIITEAS